jgi:hypothetical protein
VRARPKDVDTEGKEGEREPTDPLACLSVITTVVLFTNFGTRLLSRTGTAYYSPSGKSLKKFELSTIIADLKLLAQRIQVGLALLTHEVLYEESSKAIKVCQELEEVIEDLEAKYTIKYLGTRGILDELEGRRITTLINNLKRRNAIEDPGVIAAIQGISPKNAYEILRVKGVMRRLETRGVVEDQTVRDAITGMRGRNALEYLEARDAFKCLEVRDGHKSVKPATYVFYRSAGADYVKPSNKEKRGDSRKPAEVGKVTAINKIGTASEETEEAEASHGDNGNESSEAETFPSELRTAFTQEDIESWMEKLSNIKKEMMKISIGILW